MKEVHILLVEDDEVDAKVVQRAFKELKVANPLHFAKDGLEALDKLRSGEIPTPHIILMDLNMPRMDGIECMKQIRNDDNLKRAVIFVFTTSKAEEDKIKAYNLNAAGYIVKADFETEFLSAIRMLDHYWKVVQLPDQ